MLSFLMDLNISAFTQTDLHKLYVNRSRRLGTYDTCTKYGLQ